MWPKQKLDGLKSAETRRPRRPKRKYQNICQRKEYGKVFFLFSCCCKGFSYNFLSATINITINTVTSTRGWVFKISQMDGILYCCIHSWKPIQQPTTLGFFARVGLTPTHQPHQQCQYYDRVHDPKLLSCLFPVEAASPTHTTHTLAFASPLNNSLFRSSWNSKFWIVLVLKMFLVWIWTAGSKQPSCVVAVSIRSSSQCARHRFKKSDQLLKRNIWSVRDSAESATDTNNEQVKYSTEQEEFN